MPYAWQEKDNRNCAQNCQGEVGIMKVTFYGTRGSVPVAGSHTMKYGGNTTCVHIESPCLPPKHLLVVDSGTGMMPFGTKAMDSEVDEVTLLFTHYHHDHIQGFPLCPLTFAKDIGIHCYGPVENGDNPLRALQDMMRPPYFPLPFSEISLHISEKGILSPSDTVIVAHPEGGLRILKTDELEHSEMHRHSQIYMGQECYNLSDCLVIRMRRTNHPQKTISYRFEERSTGKVMVFLTDHENIDGMPRSLKRHLKDTDLLVMDSQYNREIYNTQTAGFGHGTPDYCVRVAHEVKASKVGLTHHDPLSSDEAVDCIVDAAHKMANEIGFKGEVFACADYLSLEV